jgi:hypothetical protein
LIELIVQVLDDVLRISRGKFFSCHMTAVTQSFFQGFQGLNDSVLAVWMPVSWHPMQLASYKRFPSPLSPRQFGGVSARHEQDQYHIPKTPFMVWLDNAPIHATSKAHLNGYGKDPSMTILDLLTLLSYIALNVDILFQIERIYKTKSSRDLSILGMSVRYAAILIILIKFMRLSDVPLIIGQGLIVLTFTTYLVFALYYRRARACG